MRKNANKIANWVRVNTPDETKDLRLAAWLFARNSDEETEELLREAIRAFFDQFDVQDPRDLLITEEDLAGSKILAPSGSALLRPRLIICHSLRSTAM